MPEGFTSVADLKMIAETNDAEFRAGLARMREGVREFQESSVANFANFDRGVTKSGSGITDFAITSLGKLGPYGKAAATALTVVKENWGLLEEAIEAAGAGDQLDELKVAFDELTQTALGAAISLFSQFSPSASQANQNANDLGKGLTFFTEMLQRAKMGLDSIRPAHEQTADTLRHSIEGLDAEINRLRKSIDDAEQAGAVAAPWAVEQLEQLTLKFDLLSQILDIQTKKMAEASDAATREAIADVVGQIELLKKQKELLGQPGEFEWYKIELRAQAALEKAGIEDKESIARLLQQLKAEYLGTSEAIASYNKQKQIEATVERTYDAMERETQNLKNRAAALGLAAGEAARLAAVESALLSIRQARDGAATDDDVRRINELADARGREAQAADDARIGRERDSSFDRQTRSIVQATEALRMSTAERARAAYVEQEYQRIRSANREATPDEIEAIERQADAIRDLTQAREDDAAVLSQIQQSGQVVARGLDDAFRRWAEGAEMTKDAVHDMAVSILADLAEIAFRKTVIEPLIDGIFGSSSSGGGLLGSIFGGARAAGGDVEAGKVYLVGEKGPELFKPPGAGTIVPNERLGGSTTHLTIQQTIDARGAYPESIAEIKRALAESNAQLPALAVAAVREATERGGM